MRRVHHNLQDRNIGIDLCNFGPNLVEQIRADDDNVCGKEDNTVRPIIDYQCGHCYRIDNPL